MSDWFDPPPAEAGLTPPVNATDIADGSVTNTEFQYLNGLTGNIQGLIDGLGTSYTPMGRTITTTSPLTIDGGSSADLTANRTLAVGTASTGSTGVVELATIAEANAGTDSSRAVTADGLLLIKPASPGTAFVGGDLTGNTRGTNSLDIQSSRGLVTHVASGNSSAAFGRHNTASGNDSCAIGENNTASGYYASAIGYQNTASGSNSLAIGNTNTAAAATSVAFGYYNSTVALGINTVLFGRQNFGTATSFSSVGVGILNNSSGATLNTTTGAITGTIVAGTVGRLSTAVGVLNTTTGIQSSAFGYSNSAAEYSVSLGIRNTASGIDSSEPSGAIAVGVLNTASGFRALAMGFGNASSNSGRAFGYYNTASGSGSDAFGTSNTASGSGAIAIGNTNTATQTNSTAIGRSCNATGTSSIAMGRLATASGNYAFCLNSSNTTTTASAYSVSVGYANACSTGTVNVSAGVSNTSGNGSVSYGKSNTASGTSSVAVGQSNSAATSGINSVLFGAYNYSTSTSYSAVGIGILNNASGHTLNTTTGAITGTIVAGTPGRLSTAVGLINTTSGIRAVAIGYSNTASGTESTALGLYNGSSNSQTVGVGYYNTCSGAYSHAFGRYNVCSVSASIAIGSSLANTTANSVMIGHDTYGRLSIEPFGIKQYHNNGYILNDDNFIGNYHLSIYTNSATPAYIDHGYGTLGISIPANSTAFFIAHVMGVDTTTNDAAAYELKGMIENLAGTTALVGSVTKTVVNEDDASWDATAVADNTNDSLQIEVTGDATNQVRWCAGVKLVVTNNETYVT